MHLGIAVCDLEGREKGEVGDDWQGLDLSNGKEIAVVNRRQILEAAHNLGEQGQEYRRSVAKAPAPRDSEQ